MRRYFNTEGACDPKKHYMVNLDKRLKQIKEQYVDRGSYFVINRGRQYGKTTTLRALAEYLAGDYTVISLDFQKVSSANFSDENTFSHAMIRQIGKAIPGRADLLYALNSLQEREMPGAQGITMDQLFDAFSEMCRIAEQSIVLLIDEVDSASNNQVFLDFLALLREYYLDRSVTPTFQSVILAGVYDIKNLKSKIRPDEQHKYNSPWNIAADFMVRMSLSEAEIAGMLAEYEADNHTGMDTVAVAQEIYAYTSGYPYLVSRICKMLDEIVSTQEGFEDGRKVWSHEGIDEAVKLILNSKAPLFDSMTRQLCEHRDMKQMLQQILLEGRRVPYNAQNELIDLTTMFGYIENNDAKFVEHYGRKFFLLYLKPIINGTGNFYIEAQTRDAKRTDVIVDYRGEQFVVELKIWRGNEYNEHGRVQLAEYLDYYHKKKGYLVSFNFNRNKKVGTQMLTVGDKIILEAVV